MTSLKERTEQMTLRPYKCPHCSGLIGNTTDYALYVGAAKFTRTITMGCSYCEKAICWRPRNESSKKL